MIKKIICLVFIISLFCTSNLLAENVGVIELKGTPQIVNCVQAKTINSGDSYQTSLQVKNTGSNSGSFYGSVTCDNGASGYLNELLVNAGETATMSGSFTGSKTTEGTATNNCNIKIIDRKSQASDTCSFQLGVKYQSGLLCNPSKVICIDAKKLRTCNSDGTDYTDKTCDNACIVLSDGSGQCGTENETTRLGDSPLGSTLIIAGAIIIGLIILALILKKKRK